jgi:hypothetical protein
VTPDPLEALRDACAPLRFSPLPELITFDELYERPAGTVQWYSAAALAAEGWVPILFDKLRTEHGPGHRLPAATNFLRVTLREPIFMVSASLYLTGRAPLLEQRVGAGDGRDGYGDDERDGIPRTHARRLHWAGHPMSASVSLGVKPHGARACVPGLDPKGQVSRVRRVLPPRRPWHRLPC